ncbi:syntaxin [Lachancea thermotolerans CBS 6340]|uniref:KLTH0D02618p n=1 Tax=Lachancea thermotolerans (strain ATCC 56472 / CBS 6340 / NRRL Y-8284) TaxID=559295 RepID=C5DG59_LACTC|nr:KLTH0D02618p [Lachancea thermotolerans CBS 6340]CAR22401.1 KLTH0D02618p [Lachancea thermotolerans CBS 6340]
MEVLKISYGVEKLQGLVDERRRLVSVLKMKPSTNDTINMKRQMNAVLDSLQAAANAATSEDFVQLNALIEKYNDAVADIPDDSLDKELYKFASIDKPPETAISKLPEPKKVRFKDDVLEYDESTQDAPTAFAPYSDDVSDEERLEHDKTRLFQTGSSESTGLDGLAVAPQLSNQELFIQQQQQLLEQDSHLDNLSRSVHSSHVLSLDIHHEVADQNDGVLQDLESLVNNSGRNLDRAKKRLRIFENTARENGPCFIIVVLFVILIVLLIIL